MTSSARCQRAADRGYDGGVGEILLDERDFPSGATTTITGAHEVAQNIRESVAIPYGSLPWDREAGSHLFNMLNDTENPTETIAEIRRVATSLPGVVPSSVRVWRDARECGTLPRIVHPDRSRHANDGRCHGGAVMAAPFPPDWLTLTDEEIRDWILATAESESGFRRSASVGPITGLWETMALAFQRGWDVGVRPISTNIDPEIAIGVLPACPRHRCRRAVA